MKVLVAGGAGYIGTHTCLSLLAAGHDIIVVDSLINSRKSNIECVQTIAHRKIRFIEADVRDKKSLNHIFANHRIEAVVNFAGHKAVSDSIDKPLEYYDNNINCALALLECMAAHDVKLIVFSSSAAVYGETGGLPITEEAGLAPKNPYGRSKLYIEQILRDLSHADNSWKVAILRYFNPVGAHPSGLIGEQPIAAPGNLMPVVSRVAAGELEKLYVFGGDYDTADGTAIRDYIHVMDLASGHSHALQAMAGVRGGKTITVNLGTGNGYSVLEVVETFKAVCGRSIPFEIVDRRQGDAACCYADPALAKAEIDWQAKLGIHDMCKDAWNWQTQLRNPG